MLSKLLSTDHPPNIHIQKIWFFRYLSGHYIFSHHSVNFYQQWLKWNACRVCFLKLLLQLQSDGLVPLTPQISYLTFVMFSMILVRSTIAVCLSTKDHQWTDLAMNIKFSRFIISFFGIGVFGRGFFCIMSSCNST